MSKETRDNTRFEHEASILVENYHKGSYYHGKMFNYSKTGMYFESNIPFKPGSTIIFGIENSPYDHCPGVYKAKVKWCKKLPEKASLYYYGVGVEFYRPDQPSIENSSKSASNKKISANTNLTDGQNIKQTQQTNTGSEKNEIPAGRDRRDSNQIDDQNSRRHPRKRFASPIHFSAWNQFYAGLVKDISRGGIFIKSQDKFPVGQELTLVIPSPTTDKSLILSGEVVRINPEGFGVKFKRKLKSSN